MALADQCWYALVCFFPLCVSYFRLQRLPLRAGGLTVLIAAAVGLWADVHALVEHHPSLAVQARAVESLAFGASAPRTKERYFGHVRFIPDGAPALDGHPPLSDLLSRLAARHGVSFPNPTSGSLWLLAPHAAVMISRDSAYADLRAVLRDLGLPGDEFSWHGMRAGAATSAANRGVPAAHIAEAGNWRSMAGLQPYIHRDASSRAAAVATAMRRRSLADPLLDASAPAAAPDYVHLLLPPPLSLPALAPPPSSSLPPRLPAPPLLLSLPRVADPSLLPSPSPSLPALLPPRPAHGAVSGMRLFPFDVYRS